MSLAHAPSEDHHVEPASETATTQATLTIGWNTDDDADDDAVDGELDGYKSPADFEVAAAMRHVT